MSSTAPISGIPTDVPAPASAPTPPSKAGASQTPAASQTDNQADLRLVIEEDQAAGTYVYKTVDPVTGKVVSQVPREQLLKMRETPDYAPGSIVNARG